MGRVLGAWAVTAAAVALTFMLVPGVGFTGNVAVPTIIFAAVFSLVNRLVKPVLQLVALPITIITLGLFALVINVSMLYLASWICNAAFGTELVISGFFSALAACFLISVLTAILGWVTGVETDPKKARKNNRRDQR
jgi:putative membrane protein